MRNLNDLLNYVEAINHVGISKSNVLIIKGTKDGNPHPLCGGDIYCILEQIKWNASHLSLAKFDIEIQSKVFVSTDVINVLEMIFLFLSTNFPNQYKFIFTKYSYLLNNIYFFVN